MYNNPYYYQPQRYTGVPQQPVQQDQYIQNMSIQNRQTLNGKTVESSDVVKAMDIPMDGSISYFPIADGSAIITKQLQMDGTSKTTVFKPFTEEKEENKYITSNDLKKAIDEIDLSDIEDLKDEIKDLKQQLKELKKKGVKNE